MTHALTPSSKHEFAFYLALLSEQLNLIKEGDEWIIKDEKLVHRLAHVVRLNPGDLFTLFDGSMHAQCQLIAFQGKRAFTIRILAKARNKTLTPHITCLLPLLKRNDFEETIAILAELGVNTIQLITTQKIARSWGKEQEYERLERIMIATAEQSKHFALPIINPPVPLADICVTLSTSSGYIVYFDPQGTPLITHLNAARTSGASNFFLLVGPEGDFTAAEKIIIQGAGAQACALTPTVLRTVHAVGVGVGAFRCL